MYLHAQYPDGPRYRVFVDGVHQPLAFEADTNQGYARCYVADDRGLVKTARDPNGDVVLVTVTVRGVVELRPILPALVVGLL